MNQGSVFRSKTYFKKRISRYLAEIDRATMIFERYTFYLIQEIFIHFQMQTTRNCVEQELTGKKGWNLRASSR